MSETTSCAICKRLGEDGRLLDDVVRWVDALAKACFQSAAVTPLVLAESTHGTLPDERGYHVGLMVTFDATAASSDDQRWTALAMRFLHRLQADVARTRLGQGIQDQLPIDVGSSCEPLPSGQDREALIATRSNEKRHKHVVSGLAVRSFSVEPIKEGLPPGMVGWRIHFVVALFPRESVARLEHATVVVTQQSDAGAANADTEDPLSSTVVVKTNRRSTKNVRPN